MKVFLFSLVLVFAFPLFRYEYNRYTEFLHQYQQEWVENDAILRDDLCQNALKRLTHGSKVHDMCNLAAQENRLDPKHRAFQQWWSTSEYVALYQKTVGTWYLAFALILASVALSIGGVTYYCLVSKRDQQYLSTMKEFATNLANQRLSGPSPVYYVPEKRNSIEWVDREPPRRTNKKKEWFR